MSSNETWLLDPKTGDYVLDGGSPVLDKGLRVPAYIRTRVHRTQWQYAPDTKYGSDFYDTKIKRNQENTKILESIMIRAMQPLITDKRATQIKLDIFFQNRSVFQFKTNIIEAQGKESDFVLTPLL